jgi:hypothetical protein
MIFVKKIIMVASITAIAVHAPVNPGSKCKVVVNRQETSEPHGQLLQVYNHSAEVDDFPAEGAMGERRRGLKGVEASEHHL